MPSGRHSRKHEKAQREPWLLGTSLPEGFKLAEKAVKLYALRMQIEEAFRDVKSTRFGLSLELHRTYQLERLQVLLLIATLALMVAWLMGRGTTIQQRCSQTSIDRRSRQGYDGLTGPMRLLRELEGVPAS